MKKTKPVELFDYNMELMKIFVNSSTDILPYFNFRNFPLFGRFSKCLINNECFIETNTSVCNDLLSPQGVLDANRKVSGTAATALNGSKKWPASNGECCEVSVV